MWGPLRLARSWCATPAEVRMPPYECYCPTEVRCRSYKPWAGARRVRPASSPRRASEVRLHRGGEGLLPGTRAVPDIGGLAGGVLRVADAAPSGPDTGRPAARARDPGDSRGEPAALRESA